MPSGLFNTSLLLNGDIARGSDFWDRVGLQLPTNGEYGTYTSNDAGFNSFTVVGEEIEVAPGQQIMQRFLLSPGSNTIHYCISTYLGGTTWSVARGYSDKIDSSGYSIGVWRSPLQQPSVKVRFSKIVARGVSQQYGWEETKDLLEEEAKDILDTHESTHWTGYDFPTGMYVNYTDPNIQNKTGVLLRYYHTDYRSANLTELTYGGGEVTSHARMFLKAHQKGFTEYSETALEYAWGLLHSIVAVGLYVFPLRYDFTATLPENQWKTYYDLGEKIPLADILDYLCEAADTFKEKTFFEAARVMAVYLIKYNWWATNTDPEGGGIHYISHSFTQASNLSISGDYIERVDTGTTAGASVSSWNHDHELMRGAKAVSKLLSVVRTNLDIVGSSFLTFGGYTEGIYETAVNTSLASLKLYADEYDQKWSYGAEGAETALTEDWWWRYDRFSDYVGENYGNGMCSVALHRIAEGDSLSDLQGTSWYPAVVGYLKDNGTNHLDHWTTANERGGRGEQKAYQGWHSYFLMYKTDPTFMEDYEDTLKDALWSSLKGSFFPPTSLNEPTLQKNAIGLLGDGDWEPRNDTNNPAILPGYLFSWTAELIEILDEPDETEISNMVSFMATYLTIIQDWHKGSGGYPLDVLERATWQQLGGGELYLCNGILDLWYFLENYTYTHGFQGTFNFIQ
jgi:hypothetical protein